MSKNVYEMVAEFRINLLRRDSAAQRELLLAYNQAFKAIEQEITEVARKIVTTKGSPSLFAEQRRLTELQKQVSDSIKELGVKATEIATKNQRLSLTAANTEAVELVAAKAGQEVLKTGGRAQVSGIFNRLPTDVISQLVGVSAQGNPVREVFDDIARELGLQTGDRIKQALVKGITLGWSPDRITRMVRREADARGGNPARSPAVVRRLHSAVRNETFRAYREATRATYQENPEVVKKWRWVSRQGPTTCVICWSQDGRTFPLTTPFASHPNCRCVMTPVLVGEKEKYVTGPERFDQLEHGVQRSILGDRSFEALEEGKVETIGDFVEVIHSAKWGTSRGRRNLDELLGKGQ